MTTVNEMRYFADETDFKKLKAKNLTIKSITFDNHIGNGKEKSKYYSASNSLVVNFVNHSYLIIKRNHHRFIGVCVADPFKSGQFGYLDTDIQGLTLSQVVRKANLHFEQFLSEMSAEFC